MRLVQVVIPAGTGAAVLDALDGEGIDFAVSEGFGRDVAVRVGFVEAQVSEPEPLDPPLGLPRPAAAATTVVT